MRFRYSILYVDDVPATLAFYEKAFGFETGFLHEGKDYGELVTGDTKLAFSAKSLMREIGKTPSDANPKAPSFELAFETETVAEDFARAVAAGAAPIQEPAEMPWGQVISYVSDPNGFLIEICAPN
ncbi:VOC family protein [Cognatishimia activa]|uniref:VOC family protein n=1 Tax=Cognatishimia activa TaxID=1715691 RepID=A0A975ER76_9RHOB|nr:VOC family protein [Cognatishimia activa]QTN36720.1 VOC family protein [Cognatishimia activa]